MMQMSSIHKIIWSIDAFEESSEMQSFVIEAIRNFTQMKKISIEPVYVLSPEQLDVSMEFTPPWIKHYRPAALKALEQKLKEVDLEGLMDPKVLVNSRASLRDSVKSLTSYARAQNADLIVVGSHGRKGLDRLLLGSFAESLLLQAKIPVLVVGPSAGKSHGFSRILYPTDFGDHALPVFMRVLKLARDLKSKITLFHVLPHPIEPVFQSGVYLLGGGWVPVPTFLEKEEMRQREQAARWLEKAKKFDVSVDLMIDRSTLGAVDAILAYAQQEKIGLIAMTAQSGPVASVLIGSICRQVVRGAPCPAWVLRKGVPTKE